MESEIKLNELRVEEVFNQRFQALGGSVGFRGDLFDGIQKLAEWLRLRYKMNQPVYFDILRNSNLNAFVTQEQDVYLIGVTDGIVRELFNRIGEVLKTLDITYREDLKSNGHDSPMREVQFILHFYSLLFVLGHEFGHIQLGHIDKQLSLKQMINERTLSASYLQEAEADTVGAFSILDGMVFNSMRQDGIFRIRQLTNAATAVGLIQIPVACIFASLFDVNTSREFTKAYPHPIVRLFSIVRYCSIS
jgi:hypothetical protein